MAMKLNTYRLTSLEEPTEEQLHALMEQVAIAARESSRRAKIEMERRMQEIVQIVLKKKRGEKLNCNGRKTSHIMHCCRTKWFG